MGVSGKRFQKQYKETLSDFKNWTRKPHAQEYLIYPRNIGPNLALDETALSNGELYTLLTNKDKRGKKGCIVAIFRGTQADQIISLITKHISVEFRNIVKEVTLDMAGSMNLIVKKCFLRAEVTTDRFHVQQLANEAVQELRIKYRWEILDQENLAYKKARAKNKPYKLEVFENGDTLRQLMARSRYALYRSRDNWTPSQAQRAKLLFEKYPDVEIAYNLSDGLRKIYNLDIAPDMARLRLARWFDQIEKAGLDSFSSIKRTFQIHHKQIINYFINRSTNASAESFNAKIKDFRRSLRGVVDVDFFLFRLTKIFA